MSSEISAIKWVDDTLILLDQSRLPLAEVDLRVNSVDQLIDAIKRLAVRGAPSLGVVGAYGVVIAMDQALLEDWSSTRFNQELDALRDARPTAVNLAWGVNQVRELIPQGRDQVFALAKKIALEDFNAGRAMGNNGADWLIDRLGDKKFNLLTHCNTGSLATTGTGTALGVIKELHTRGNVTEVFADETRPLLQGSRLTAWELDKCQIPYRIQPDGAAAMAILGGKIDAALIGADRIAKNGDTINKIGSLGVALACHIAGIPFLVVAPESTVDRSMAEGAGTHIEVRGDREITHFGDLQVAPEGAKTFNPAFDVTPAKYVTVVVTELGTYEIAEGATL